MNIYPCNLKFKETLIPLNLNEVKYIVIHHAEAKIATSEDIHNWHLQNGWAGAGYNEYIRKNGSVYIMRGDNVGAQCQGYNSSSYGICCEGDYENEASMPTEQYASLLERVRFHRMRFPNKSQVVPHKALCQTACPGKNFPMSRLLSEIDIVPVHWAEKYWCYLNDNGIKVNEKKYDNGITRGELFCLLAKVMGYKEI